jgi:uncharacterized membrane protein
MALLILGIVLFLGAHSLKIAAPVRAGLIGSMGEKRYRGLYSAVSVVGFILIVWGFHTYRQEGWVQVWVPPVWTRHLTITLMWFAFVAIAAMGPKPSRIKGWLRHPMLVAIKIWALAHLLANGDLGGMILFGSFLVWAVVDRISVKRRGDMGAAPVSRFTRSDGIIVVAGTVAYLAMMVLHPYLIGVAVIG